MNNPPSPADNPPPFWRRFQGKDISYLTLPLLIGATITEAVILSIGFIYQRGVCVPQGLGVTFFGIGPIGAVMLAVELLKLPLAIWTASRRGWMKVFMILVGLPLICVLTFQLVKDMAVYEMSVAMKPASAFQEKASVEESKILRLNAELENRTKDEVAFKAFFDARKADRDRRLAELATKQAEAKAAIEESLRRNELVRNEALVPTEFQRKELSEVESRQAGIVARAEADAVLLNKAISSLRARREVELYRAKDWNAEEARIENEYAARLSDYTNRKNAYDKAKAEYDKATFLKRQVITVPADPGVPPVREVNTRLKPTILSELEEQIKNKEAELVAVDSRRREGVAQIEADARRIREDIDRRSSAKRDETDRRREELLAALTSLSKGAAAEAAAINADFDSAVAKERAILNPRPVEVIRAELADAGKVAEALYEQREAAIRATQVHRIATTVEIVRGLLFGERPMSVTATAKERGDILTDQISMVRIWVYPVLAFIVAFLPTLMVEIGFSTLFKETRVRPPYRVGFLGRGLHKLYIRAGRQKILRAEREAAEAVGRASKLEAALARVKEEAAAEVASLNEDLRAARAALDAESRRHTEEAHHHAEEIRRKELAHRDELRRREEESNTRYEQLSEDLNRATLEIDDLRASRAAEVERQVRLRQDDWLARLARMRAELEAGREAAEAERAKLIEEHREKALALAEEAKAAALRADRRVAEAEVAAGEKIARLALDLQEARLTVKALEEASARRDKAHAEALEQAKVEAVREMEKASREESRRTELLRADFDKTLRRHEAESAHRLALREQELSRAFEARLAEEKEAAEKAARQREDEAGRAFESRLAEEDARLNLRLRQAEEDARASLAQREQQWRNQAELKVAEARTRMDLELRRREADFKDRQDARDREAEVRLREELRRQEASFIAAQKQREQDLLALSTVRDEELRARHAEELKAQEDRWKLRTDAAVQAAEERFAKEAREKDEALRRNALRLEQQLQAKADDRLAELQARLDAESALVSQRDQELAAREESRAEEMRKLERKWEASSRLLRADWEARIAQAEKERDEARRDAAESARRVAGLEERLKEVSRLFSGWKSDGDSSK